LLGHPLVISKEIPYIYPMIIGRITAKAQTTIPRAVRMALGVKPGDEISYEIEGDRVILRRAGDPFDRPFAAFTEWSDDLDAAYDSI
jgi:antitoxin PrlF